MENANSFVPKETPKVEAPLETTPGKYENAELSFDHVMFDFDSTISMVEGLDFLADLYLEENPDLSPEEKARISQEVKDITKKGMDLGWPFDKTLEERMKLIRPTRDQVQRAGELIAERISPSFLENKEFFEKFFKQVYVISGGFIELMLPTLRKLRIAEDHVFANAFVYDENGFAIGADHSRHTAQHGGKILQVEALELTGTTVIIGDGHNDAVLAKKNGGPVDIYIFYTEHADGKRKEKLTPMSDLQAGNFNEVVGHTVTFKQAA